jgi:hypothetical protein
MELSADESKLLHYDWFFILAPEPDNKVRGVVERVANYEAAMRSFAVNTCDKRKKSVCLLLRRLDVRNHRADSFAVEVQGNKLPEFFPQDTDGQLLRVPLLYMMEVHDFHAKRYDKSDGFTKTVPTAPAISAERLSEIVRQSNAPKQSPPQSLR